jgi:hypothetical protein
LYVEDDFTEGSPGGELGSEESEVDSDVLRESGPIDLGEELAQGVASESVVGGSGLWERHGIVSEVKERKEWERGATVEGRQRGGDFRSEMLGRGVVARIA